MFRKDREDWENFCFYVKGKEVGYLDCKFDQSTYDYDEDPKAIYICNVRIYDKYQGKGYGKKMMNELVYYLKATYPKYTKYALDTWTENIPAYKSYLNAGFKVIKKSEVCHCGDHPVYMTYERGDN